MLLKELLKDVTTSRMTASLETEITHVVYDSRKAVPGSLFVAVRGYETDGHKYIPAAVEAGSSVIICEEKPPVDVPYVIVDNSRKALALISKNFFGDPCKDMKMIGMTGTNGKTTTTYLVKHVIEDVSGSICGLIGTNQNMIGDKIIETERTTPESYELYALFAQMRDAGCDCCIMEVSSHSLYLDRVAGVHYAVAAFSNLTQDHLDFHKTMENYRDAKGLLFRQCDTAVINADDEAGVHYIKTAPCKVFTYSAKEGEADLKAEDIRLNPAGVEFEAVTAIGTEYAQIGIPGMFSVYNALCATGILINLGYSLTDIVTSLKKFETVKGRAEVVPTDTDYTVMIDYAHTPDGIENILKAARGFTKGRLIALFGCGGDRDRTKRPKMGKMAADLADFCIVTSDNPRTEQPGAIIEDILEGMKDTNCPFEVIEDRRKAIVWALDHAQKGDTIVMMGKGHETYQEINHVKHHLDEREEVLKYFQK